MAGNRDFCLCAISMPSKARTALTTAAATLLALLAGGHAGRHRHAGLSPSSAHVRRAAWLPVYMLLASM